MDGFFVTGTWIPFHMDVFAWLTATSKSFVFIAAAGMASLGVLGCSSSPTTTDASIEKPGSVSVGQRYSISTGSESRGRNFTGRVTEVDEDSVVMVDPHVEAWADHSWPLIGKIPGNHPFKGGKGVGRQQRVGDVTINRADIVSIAAADDGG